MNRDDQDAEDTRDGRDRPDGADWPRFHAALDERMAAAFLALDEALAACGPALAFKPTPEEWSPLEVAEHVTLTDQFLLLLSGKLARKGRDRAGRGEHIPSFTPHLTLLDELGSSARRWDAPASMLPSGRMPLARVRSTLFEDRERCRAVLASLPPGAGALADASFSPLGTRFDTYQFLALIALHGERHARQIRRLTAAAQAST